MILVTGATGFVGNRLMKDLKNVIAAPSLRNMTEDDIRRLVENSGCDTIIHTAAISDISECAKCPEESYFANVTLPVFLARAANGRKLICFSSDQVYSGCDEEGPYDESTVKPGNLYAEEKSEMEKRVLDIVPEAVMLRAEWMYDNISYKSNYFKIVTTADELTFSSGEYRGVTYIREVSEAMEAVTTMPGGVYNFGSETNESIYDITKKFLHCIGRDAVVKDRQKGHNLWMDCSKARAYGVVFSDVLNGLKCCAKDYGLVIKD